MFIHFHRTDLTLLVFNNHSSHFSHPHVSKSWTSDGSDFGIWSFLLVSDIWGSLSPFKAIYKAFKVCCIETHRHKHFWYVLPKITKKIACHTTDTLFQLNSNWSFSTCEWGITRLWTVTDNVLEIHSIQIYGNYHLQWAVQD